MSKKTRIFNLNINNHYYASPTAATAVSKTKLADAANITTITQFLYPILAFLFVGSLSLLPSDQIKSTETQGTTTTKSVPTVKSWPVNGSSPIFPFLKVEYADGLSKSGDDASVSILTSKKVSSVTFFSPSRKRHMPRCTPSYISKLEQHKDANYAAHGSGVTVTVTRRYFGLGGFDIITKRPGVVQSSFAEDQTFACWIGSPPPSIQGLPLTSK